MKRYALLCACAAAALMGTSAATMGQNYNDQYQNQEYQQNNDNRSMQQRGMDALQNFLGTDNGSANSQVTPDAIVRELEQRNFHNISQPVQHGPVYLVYAIDPNGQDVELSIDASSGRIVNSRYRG